jgi:hypothetical protein
MIRTGLAAALVLLSLPAAARAGGPICDKVESDVVEIDGMLDDWQGTRKSRAGGDEPGFDLRCAYDDQQLYLAVKVTDHRIIRTRSASAQREDALTVELAATESAGKAVLVALPGAAKVAPRRTWSGKALPANVRVEDTLQPDGWSLELAVPLARLGLGASPPSAWARVLYRDVDASGGGKPVELRGDLTLAGAVDLSRAFLRAAKLDKKDIRLDVKADLGGGAGPERVIAGGTVVGVLADKFGFMTLPVASAADVLKVEVRDLGGNGKASIVTELRQKGGGGSRTIVCVWRWAGEARFDRVLAFEVAKERDGRRLSNRWSYAPRKGKGADIAVAPGEVTGWDEDSWAEEPATDVKPILLPWEPKNRTKYRFDGETAREVAATAAR